MVNFISEADYNPAHICMDKDSSMLLWLRFQLLGKAPGYKITVLCWHHNVEWELFLRKNHVLIGRQPFLTAERCFCLFVFLHNGQTYVSCTENTGVEWAWGLQFPPSPTGVLFLQGIAID